MYLAIESAKAEFASSAWYPRGPNAPLAHKKILSIDRWKALWQTLHYDPGASTYTCDSNYNIIVVFHLSLCIHLYVR